MFRLSKESMKIILRGHASNNTLTIWRAEYAISFTEKKIILLYIQSFSDMTLGEPGERCTMGTTDSHHPNFLRSPRHAKGAQLFW